MRVSARLVPAPVVTLTLSPEDAKDLDDMCSVVLGDSRYAGVRWTQRIAQAVMVELRGPLREWRVTRPKREDA